MLKGSDRHWVCQISNAPCHLQVKKGDLVYDPFVGTGSILVAAAHFGAHTMGADIDIRVVRDGEQLRPTHCMPHVGQRLL